jgi:NAD-dependent dihydropyrimidine dehydrogenase PreA subunit
MPTDVYHKLAQHLDNLPAGYPATKSGVEIRILKQLFTPDEAALSLHLTLIAENARVLARRAGRTVGETKALLEQMEKKGLLFVQHEEGAEPLYQATSFVIGIYEFQLNKLNANLARDFEEYSSTWFNLEHWKKTPQLRTIPVGVSIEIEREILPYEKAEEIVRSVNKIAVAPCICRQEKQLLGEGCDRPSEVCLVFEKAADYYIHNHMAREIDIEETLQIIESANEAGLVLQPGNSAKPMSICACCGCCCGVLINIKRHPKPASIVSTPFVAELDREACTGCGICKTRCQMKAIDLDNGCAALDTDRCIGCGLCISTCPPKALRLKRKPQAEQPLVPKNSVDAHIRLGKARGKFKNSEIVSMVIKSKLDRLLAKSDKHHPPKK